MLYKLKPREVKTTKNFDISFTAQNAIYFNIIIVKLFLHFGGINDFSIHILFIYY